MIHTLGMPVMTVALRMPSRMRSAIWRISVSEGGSLEGGLGWVKAWETTRGISSGRFREESKTDEMMYHVDGGRVGWRRRELSRAGVNSVGSIVEEIKGDL